MEGITIRRVTVDDIDDLQALARQTYTETFAEHNTKENLETYLNKAFSSNWLVKEIQEKNSQWYFATIENKKAGHLKLNFGNAQTELQDKQAMEIERIYVLRQFQGNNIGRLLLQKAISIAQNNQVKYIWLGVWEKNRKALDFYKKHGFIKFSQHSFFVGDDEQTDWLMKLSLTDSAII